MSLHVDISSLNHVSSRGHIILFSQDNMSTWRDMVQSGYVHVERHGSVRIICPREETWFSQDNMSMWRPFNSPSFYQNRVGTHEVSMLIITHSNT
jgi:hypothetical protein